MIEINTLTYDICYTARKIYQFLTKEFRPYDITPEQFVILTALFEEEGVSQMELALKLDKDKNNIKAIVDILEKKEYILKKENILDKRAYSLYITNKAKKLFPILKEKEEKIKRTLTSSLSLEEVKVSTFALKKIRENID